MEVRVRGDSQIMEYTVPLAKLQQPFLTSTTGNWDMTNGQANYVFGATISNLPDPVDPYDVATKAYADNKILGLAWKEPAKVKADSNVDVSTLAAGDSIDGVTLKAGDRVLLTEQTTGTENGVWVVPASAPATRAADWAVGATAANYSIFVSQGTYQEQSYTVSNNTGGDVIGTHTLTFIQFAGPGLLCTEVFSDCFLGTNGSPGPYSLQEDNIVTNTERVYLNGVRQRPTEDYTIDNSYGEVTFTFNLKNNPGQTDIVCVDYCHDELAAQPGVVLTNLIHDWDAENLTGLDDGDPVASVPDAVGTLALEQTTAASRPTYVTDDLCFSLIKFDQTTNHQYLVTEATIELFKDRDATFVIAYQLDVQSTSVGKRLFTHGNEDLYMSAFGASHYPAGYEDTNDAISVQPDRNIGNNFAPGFYIVHLRRDGDQVKMRVTGNDEGDVTLPTNTAPETAILQIAGNVSANKGYSANMQVSRVLVYDRALTDAEMLKNETALAREVNCYAETPKPENPTYVPAAPPTGGPYDGTYKHWHWYDLSQDHGDDITTWPAWRGGVNLTQSTGAWNTVKPKYMAYGNQGYNLHGRTHSMNAVDSFYGTPSVLIDQRDGSASANHSGFNTDPTKPFKMWNEHDGHTEGTFIIVWMPVIDMFTESYNKTLFSHGGLGFSVTTNSQGSSPGHVSVAPDPYKAFEPWSDQPTGWYRQWNLNISMFDRYDSTLRCSRNGYLRSTHTGLTSWANPSDVLNIGEGDTIQQLRYCMSFLVAEIIILPYSIYQRDEPGFMFAWDYWWSWLINYYSFMFMYVPWTSAASWIPDNHGDDPALNLIFGKQLRLG